MSKRPAKLVLLEKMDDGGQMVRMKGLPGPVIARALRMLKDGHLVKVRRAKRRGEA